MLNKGDVVRSLAGRDKEKLLAVVSVSSDGVLVCDGKERPVERPKRKNIRHVQATAQSLDPTELASNRALKKALARLNSESTVNT